MGTSSSPDSSSQRPEGRTVYPLGGEVRLVPMAGPTLVLQELTDDLVYIRFRGVDRATMVVNKTHLKAFIEAACKTS